MFFVLKFELILIIGSNNVLTEGARKVYRGRRVGQGCVIGIKEYIIRETVGGFISPVKTSLFSLTDRKYILKHILILETSYY
jgi:hypothetical protein